MNSFYFCPLLFSFFSSFVSVGRTELFRHFRTDRERMSECRVIRKAINKFYDVRAYNRKSGRLSNTLNSTGGSHDSLNLKISLSSF